MRGHLHSHRHWDVKCVVASNKRIRARLRVQAGAINMRTTRLEATSSWLSTLPVRMIISVGDLMVFVGFS